MRLNTAANLAATAALLLVGVHLLSFEMSPEREDLDSKQLRARINSVRAQADETRQLIAAMRRQAVVEATPAPVALPRRRPPPNARRMRADTSKLNAVVLAVMAHDREASLRDCLRAVLTSSGATQLLRVGVSMDAPYAYAALRAEAQQAAKAYDIRIDCWEHAYAARPKTPRVFAGSPESKISEHVYKALVEGFRVDGARYVILLEDDLRAASDFFSVFSVGVQLLENDETLWCVSAWNDNAGIAGMHGWRPDALRRTAYFPGLGWLTAKQTWDSVLQPSWPAAPTTGWDHWLRAQDSLQGRECVFPEIPRVKHVATGGSTNVRGGEAAAFERRAFAGASTVETFELAGFDEAELKEAVLSAKRVSVEAAKGAQNDVSVVVKFVEEHQKLAKLFDLWHTELRGYNKHGVLALRRKGGFTIYLLDMRRCPWVEERISDANSVVIKASQPGVACTSVCRAAQKTCDPKLLVFADRCDLLRKHFPCEAGCGHQLGPELPAFVARPGRDTSGQCLVASGGFTPTCDAKHPATQRLCVCV